MDVAAQVNAGRLKLEQVDPAELSPGEFLSRVRAAVDVAKSRVVVIDSLNGLVQAMPDEKFVMLQLHDLLMYLGQKGVLTLLVVAEHGVVGKALTGQADLSYLADTVILVRYFEARGAVRKAISVVKKRTGNHEKTIREYDISSTGVIVGEPLTNFHGVLTGTPMIEPAQGKSSPR
jgi:circadian clock protein KaiC